MKSPIKPLHSQEVVKEEIKEEMKEVRQEQIIEKILEEEQKEGNLVRSVRLNYINYDYDPIDIDEYVKELNPS